MVQHAIYHREASDPAVRSWTYQLPVCSSVSAPCLRAQKAVAPTRASYQSTPSVAYLQSFMRSINRRHVYTKQTASVAYRIESGMRWQTQALHHQIRQRWSAEFIILNAKIIVFDTEFLVFDREFMICSSHQQAHQCSPLPRLASVYACPKASSLPFWHLFISNTAQISHKNVAKQSQNSRKSAQIILNRTSFGRERLVLG